MFSIFFTFHPPPIPCLERNSKKIPFYLVTFFAITYQIHWYLNQYKHGYIIIRSYRLDRISVEDSGFWWAHWNESSVSFFPFSFFALAVVDEGRENAWHLSYMTVIMSRIYNYLEILYSTLYWGTNTAQFTPIFYICQSIKKSISCQIISPL